MAHEIHVNMEIKAGLLWTECLSFPSSYVESPRWWYLEMGALGGNWALMTPLEWDPQDGVNAFIRRNAECSLLKVAICKPGRRPSPGT